MPGRDEAKNRHRRWSFYFANKPGVSTLKRNLLTVIDNGNAKVTLREISACRVDCVWPKSVTYQSAARLVTLAKEINASFEILGLPKPVADEADISEGKAASAGQVADSPGAQEKEKEEEEEEEGAEPDRKRPCLDTSEGAPPGKQAKETPAADNSQPASQDARQAASAFAPPPSHLLCLKAMTAASRLHVPKDRPSQGLSSVRESVFL